MNTNERKQYKILKLNLLLYLCLIILVTSPYHEIQFTT